MIILTTSYGSVITCSKTKDYEQAIRELYKSESDSWHKTVHKNEADSESNLKSTLDTFDNNYDVYLINENEKNAAFFAIYRGELSILDGFHVAKENRNKEFLDLFWSIIKGKFENKIYTTLFKKNEQAIQHLLRQGFSVFKESDLEGKKIVTLELKY